jgi:hypothetical protein
VPNQHPQRSKAAGDAPDSDVVQLVYISTAAPALSAADLDAIAATSRARNEGAGLTGLLLHQGRSFYGVLEGPKRRVFARMERIITDPRHFRLRILHEEEVATRRFANWSFGVLPAVDPGPGRSVERPEEFIQSFAKRLK